MEADIESRQKEGNALDAELASKNEKIETLTSKCDELKTIIDSLESSNRNLSEDLDKLKATKEGLKESNVDIDMHETEVDSIVNELMAEHPEWFSTDGSQNAGTGAYQGEHVGTPDNTANTPQIQFDPSDTEGLSKDVTVY